MGKGQAAAAGLQLSLGSLGRDCVEGIAVWGKYLQRGAR